jgi:hypothetical protein
LHGWNASATGISCGGRKEAAVRDCSRCGGGVEDAFRFCPWCGDRRRTKVVEFFQAHPRIDAGRALRVSRYLGGDSEEGHVRFSVWAEAGESARAEAAVSLDQQEANRLAVFLRDPVARSRSRALIDAIRTVRDR